MSDAVYNLGGLVDAANDEPSRTAFIDVDAEGQSRAVSYGELAAQAEGIAQGLRARGLPIGDRVAVLATNSVRQVATLLGIMRAGLIAVPINIKFPRALIHDVLIDSGAQLVFHDTARQSVVPAGYQTVALDGQPWLDFQAPGASPAWRPAPQAPALMLYTSGSTGRPKGVLLSHEGQLWTVRARQKQTPLDAERALIAAPLYHMNALALSLLVLACRATAVLLPQFTASSYIRAISEHRCTWLTAVPPMIAMMLRERELLAESDLSSVRAVRMGSAPVSPSLLAQLHNLLPSARVINAYGTTEGGPVVFGPHPQGVPTPALSVGYPQPGVDIRLLAGPDDPPGVGVLAMRSPGLMLGYHQRPDLPPPFTEDGFFITGDVFQRDEQGFYTFVGRRDDMFVCGGENIHPGDVERMLERHPAVQQACVVPISDDIKGAKPVAFVVTRSGQQLDEDTLKRYALENAPVYQHPRHVWFVAELPLAATNKIDRKRLQHEAAERIMAKVSV